MNVYAILVVNPIEEKERGDAKTERGRGSKSDQGMGMVSSLPAIKRKRGTRRDVYSTLVVNQIKEKEGELL